ncbi:hypothetical protein [Thermodesulfovibrio sp. TK110]
MYNILKDYKSFVGPREFYDIVSALQFSILTFFGLREHHFLLDIGCGSLRGGKLFIPYLLPGRYFGIEPEQWLIEEGIKNELGKEILQVKRPMFSNDSNFNLTIFNQKFDFILAQSIFSHASQKQISKCLSEAKKVMKETSIFIATFMEGEKNYKGDNWVYPECVTYTWDYMRELVRMENLCCEKIFWPHPAGQTWFAIFFCENKKNIRILFDDKIKQKSLETELKICRERLRKIENHPYVKIGLKVYRLLKLLKNNLMRG